MFELLPAQANTLIEDPEKFWDTADKQGNPKSTLAFLKEALSVLTASHDYAACIALAQKLFVECHRDNILDLTSALPEDARVIEPGTGADLGPFWTGAKRFPRVAYLNVGRPGEAEAAAAGHGASEKPNSPQPDDGENGGAAMTDSNSNTVGGTPVVTTPVASVTADGANKEHVEFLQFAANLFAFMLNVPAVTDKSAFAAQLLAAPAPAPYEPPKVSNIQIEDESARNAAAAGAEDGADEELALLDAEIAAVTAQLKALDVSKMSPLRATEFEKDDDSNYHIDLITALANMRAWNYKIRPATRLHVKTVAGKIIAALATTTAMITGLTTLEYYKLALGMHFTQKDQFCNTNVNLAVSVFNAFEPDNVIRAAMELNVDTLQVPYPRGYTTWDSVPLTVTADTSVKELLEQITRVHHGVKPIQLFKDGLTEKDVSEGRGQALVMIMDEIKPTMALNMLKRDNISEGMRLNFEKQVKDAETFNANLRAQLGRKVLSLYKEIYGPLVDPTRDFLLLDGVYEPPQGEDEVEFHGEAAVKLAQGAEDPYSVTVRATLPKLKVFFDPTKVNMTI